MVLRKTSGWGTYVILVDLDANVKHLTVGVRVGVVAADHFTCAGERRVGHVVVIRRTAHVARRGTHAPAQHAQRQ